MNTYTFAGVQTDIFIGDIESNLARMQSFIETTTDQGAWLTVFPECSTTGYCYQSLEEAKQFAEPLDGQTTNRVIEMCRAFQTRIVFGLIESDEDRVFNSLLLVTAEGVAGHYRKIHLPKLGLDRFTTSGDMGFPVVDVDGVKIGLNICYDSSFPESSRILALDGADVIVLPTNWPPTSGLTADVIPAARALENHVYYMAINRVGTERGFEFIGKSRICGPSGKTLGIANHAQESILYADIDPTYSRAKHLVNIPGEHEVHRIDDRHPNNYDRISRN
ncbi:MAG: carbon-nitrogen hydrolase family protein [Planctomycetota bacterium]